MQAIDLCDQALALHAMLCATDLDLPEGDVWIQSFPMYSGREKGICLVVSRAYRSKDEPRLFIFFAEAKSGDSLLIGHWTGDIPYLRAPAVPDDDHPMWLERASFGFCDFGPAISHIKELTRSFYDKLTRGVPDGQ